MLLGSLPPVVCANAPPAPKERDNTAKKSTGMVGMNRFCFTACTPLTYGLHSCLPTRRAERPCRRSSFGPLSLISLVRPIAFLSLTSFSAGPSFPACCRHLLSARHIQPVSLSPVSAHDLYLLKNPFRCLRRGRWIHPPRRGRVRAARTIPVPTATPRCADVPSLSTDPVQRVSSGRRRRGTSAPAVPSRRARRNRTAEG